jgi:chromosome segregation ATPase
MSIKQMLERIEEECDNKDYELLMAEKHIAELVRHADIQSRLLADMADEQGRLQRALADAQDYAAELEAKVAELEAAP